MEKPERVRCECNSPTASFIAGVRLKIHIQRYAQTRLLTHYIIMYYENMNDMPSNESSWNHPWSSFAMYFYLNSPRAFRNSHSADAEASACKNSKIVLGVGSIENRIYILLAIFLMFFEYMGVSLFIMWGQPVYREISWETSILLCHGIIS